MPEFQPGGSGFAGTPEAYRTDHDQLRRQIAGLQQTIEQLRQENARKPADRTQAVAGGRTNTTASAATVQPIAPAANWSKFVTVLANQAAADWTAFPAALTELFGATRHRTRCDLAGLSVCRLIVNVTTAAIADAKLTAQYSLDDGVTWEPLSEGGWPSVVVDAAGLRVSGWKPIRQAVRGADPWLRVVGEGGDGAATLSLGLVAIEFRSLAVPSVGTPPGVEPEIDEPEPPGP